MKKTQFMIEPELPAAFDGDLLVYCREQAEKSFNKFGKSLGRFLRNAATLGDFSGKSNEVLMYYPNQDASLEKIRAKRVAFCGIGKISKETSSIEIREMLRSCGGEVARVAEKVKAARIMLVLPVVKAIDAMQTAECLCEGIALGDYRFARYKTKKGEEKVYEGLTQVIISANKTQATAFAKGVSLGENAGKAACLARDMANEPANEWTAKKFGDVATSIAKQYRMTCRVLEKKDMKRLGMGGILAVNQGSSEPPKLAIIEYRSLKASQTLLLVGKGITFDSGGISLKPAAGMEHMKFDMCGGAAVLACMQAVGEEQPELNIIAMVPASDNVMGSSSVKPGDVIRHYGGITSEIVNTDAEGRMVLADALAYGIKKYKPDFVVDIATLTGAAIIGLGHHCTGLLGNDDRLIDRLIEAGKSSGEPLWRLPLNKDYAKQIDSKIADIKNAGGRDGGTITAAAYLEKFVGKTAWAHLDIAGTAWDFTEKTYIPKGPSGIGVRTLLELIRSWQVSQK